MERRAAIEEAVSHLPLMLTVEQTCDVLGIGRSLAYSQIRCYLATGGREGIPAVRIGSAIRVPRAGLVDLMLAAAPTESGPATLHAVSVTTDPEPKPLTRRASRARPSHGPRSHESMAQLPFAEPNGA